MVVEPNGPQASDHFTALVAESFEFDVRVVDFFIQQVLVERSNRRQVTPVFRAASDQNTNITVDEVPIPSCDSVNVVGFPIAPVDSQQQVGSFVFRRFVENFQQRRHVSGLTKQAAEHIGVLECQPSTPAASHRKSFDAAARSVGDGAVIGVDVRNQFREENRFDGKSPVRGVLVKRAAASIGKHHDHCRPTTFFDAFMQHADGFQSREFVASVAMKVVDDGKLFACGGFITRRQVDAEPNVLFDQLAAKRQVLRVGWKALAWLEFVNPHNRRSGGLLLLFEASRLLSRSCCSDSQQ